MLTGTLKDFGIAEILQLIGQQSKSGVIHLESGEDQIHILISDGNVVRAESADRKQRDRLGSMLVRARLISATDLEAALEAQRRTLRRLGDILIEQQLVSRLDLKEMTALQTTETIYRLFDWKSGTYKFEPGAVEWDPETDTPLRAESVLMEGFRRVDEWPMVRRKISSPLMTFVREGELPGPGEGELSGVGPQERRVFELADPGRTVERIVDLSRLGEFETCHALLALVNHGLLRAVAPPRRSAAAGVGAYARSWRERLRRGAAGLLATLAIASVLAGLAWLASEREGAFARGGGPSLREHAAQAYLARYRLARLAHALEVWRLEHGDYPVALASLVESGLLRPEDVRCSAREECQYRRDASGGFVLLPPLP